MLETNRVVKFMVNVRLIEKRVKSHVGRVMVVNVTIQYSRPGKIRSEASTARPRSPKEDGPSWSFMKAVTADAAVESGPDRVDDISSIILVSRDTLAIVSIVMRTPAFFLPHVPLMSCFGPLR